jgi:hypothetical protein
MVLPAMGISSGTILLVPGPVHPNNITAKTQTKKRGAQTLLFENVLSFAPPSVKIADV